MNPYLKIGIGIFALGVAAHATSIGHEHGLYAGINSVAIWAMVFGLGWIGIYLLRRALLAAHPRD